MLKQAIEVFKREYNEKGDSLILDSYIPADGTYIIVEEKKNDFVISDTIEIKYDKKSKDISNRASINPNTLDFICCADYYSKLIDMNKPIDSKKIIHSNNYMSFFIKKENLTSGKLTNELIDKYYDILKNPSEKYKGKSKSLSIYKNVENSIGPVNIALIDKISLWIKRNIFNNFKQITGKDYLKIFFKYSDEDYIREGQRYLIPNIYNSNDTNEVIEGDIYGLPNNNLNLNSKKPYLENKTRKVAAPYLLNQDEIIIQKKFFDYLMNKAVLGECNIYIGDKIQSYEYGCTPERYFNGIYMRIAKGMEVEIHDYDIITNYYPELVQPFKYQNIIGADIVKLKGDYKEYNTYRGMQQLLNEILFNKFLIPNYFTDPKDISLKDDNLFCNLLLCRTALFNWFYKGIDNNIWGLLDKATSSIVKGSILKGALIKALDQFNLRMSLKEYYEGGNNMADIYEQIKLDLKEKINQKETVSMQNDNEYFFAVGQLASFFISRNRGKKKPLSLAKPFISAKNNDYLKSRLKALYEKYDYDIDYSFRRFTNMYAMVSGYVPNSEVDSDTIIAGFMHSNLLYEKTEKEYNREDNKNE